MVRQSLRNFVAPALRSRKSGCVIYICWRILKNREPDKDILSLSHRQSTESVFAIFRHKIRRDGRSQTRRRLLERVLEEIHKISCHWSLKIINGSNDQACGDFVGADRGTFHIFKGEAGRRRRGAQKRIFGGDTLRGITSPRVLSPKGPAIKIL